MEADPNKIIQRYQQRLADAEFRAIVAESLVAQYREQEATQPMTTPPPPPVDSTPPV